MLNEEFLPHKNTQLFIFIRQLRKGTWTSELNLLSMVTIVNNLDDIDMLSCSIP